MKRAFPKSLLEILTGKKQKAFLRLNNKDAKPDDPQTYSFRNGNPLFPLLLMDQSQHSD
jgi:hypothetical protein